MAEPQFVGQTRFFFLIGDFSSNKVLIISAVAWAIAQILKVLVALIQEKKIVWSYFVTSGGMPSSHSAIVCALATSIALTFGTGTAMFAIAAVLALIVMYDAAGVRQSVGKQSAIINRILKGSKLNIEQLREFIGHTPFQVFIGAVVGILVAWTWVKLAAP
jgi:acid phosphatase family membrane protein YuiD